MGTLGGRGGWWLTFRNDGTTTIPKYRACESKPVAALERLGNEYIVPAQEVQTSSTAKMLGVVQEPVVAGGLGIVCVQGVTLWETDGGVQDGEDLETMITSSNEGKADTQSAGNTVGFALMDDVTEWIEPDFGTLSTTLALAVVNFMSSGTLATA